MCFVYMLYILCHIHTSNTLRIMALVPDSICRCRHWGLEMPIPWSQSQSKELVVPGFELDSGINYAKCIYPIIFRSPPMGERHVGSTSVCSIEGGGRDRDSTTRNTTQPLQVYICCYPGSEILPFFTCHNPICCAGQIRWLPFLVAFTNTVRSG